MKSLSPKAKRWIAAGVLVLLAILVTGFIVVFHLDNRGPVRLVQNYVTAINEQDFERFCACFTPDDQEKLRAAAEQAGGEKAFFERNYSFTFDPQNPYENYGDSVIVEVSDFDAQRQTLEGETYRGLNLAEHNIAAITNVTCTMTTKGSLYESSERVQVVCMRIDRRWYLYTMTAVEQQVTD